MSIRKLIRVGLVQFGAISSNASAEFCYGLDHWSIQVDEMSLVSTRSSIDWAH